MGGFQARDANLYGELIELNDGEVVGDKGFGSLGRGLGGNSVSETTLLRGGI